MIRRWSSLLLLLACAALASDITSDSTQPRGAPTQGTDAPIGDGFRAPAYRASEGQDGYFHDWTGTMMANSARDPAFWATLSVANRDVIALVNAMSGDPADPTSELGAFLVEHGLSKDGIVRDDMGKLQPEALLPIVADFCIRCHSPVGWLEGHSEPRTVEEPFLSGQFWGTELVEQHLDGQGHARYIDQKVESESEMDGVQCDFCHRAATQATRTSAFQPGIQLPKGSGSYVVCRQDPFGDEVRPNPSCVVDDFQEKPFFCGTCHDVTNPIVATRTAGAPPGMLHPIERTFTEWYWSSYGPNGDPCDEDGDEGCEDCHEPMEFQGAQTWLPLGINRLWGDLDQRWNKVGAFKGYYWDGRDERAQAYEDACARDVETLERAAELEIDVPDDRVHPGDTCTVTVKVTNRTGHKLPTGFSEGRRIWIHLKATVYDEHDDPVAVILDDGAYDPVNAQILDPVSKVYAQEVEALGYPASVIAPGDEEFHFALMNTIVKDNRIPPRGFNRAAYEADGAFVVPRDPLDTDYPSGQSWDITPYKLAIPLSVALYGDSTIEVVAELWYQTFDRRYIDFLDSHDVEPTIDHGGRAMRIPAGPYGDAQNWGDVLRRVWADADPSYGDCVEHSPFDGSKGPPVLMETEHDEIEVRLP